MKFETVACIGVSALMAGCAGPADPKVDSGASSELATCGDPTETEAFVITSMAFTRENSPDSIEGFDLDSVASALHDPQGCGHADYTDTAGTPGIDNAFASLVPVLESIGAGAVEGLITDAINSGELLVLLELQRVESIEADTCVDLEVYRGDGVPLMGTDGAIQMDQTFALDASRPSTSASGGSIEGGVFEIRGVVIELPVQILDEFLEFELEGGAVQLAWQEDGTAVGRLAGGVSVASLAGQIAAISDIGGLQDVVPPLLEEAADLWPDENGACTHLSIGFEITARPAFVLTDGA